VVVQLVTAVTESVLPLPDLGELPLEDFRWEVLKGSDYGAFGWLSGRARRNYLVSNADGRSL